MRYHVLINELQKCLLANVVTFFLDLPLDSTGSVCAALRLRRGFFRPPTASNPTGRVSEEERLACRLAVFVDLGIFPGQATLYRQS